MQLTVRRLGLGDEAVLALLAREDADFDIAGRGSPRPALTEEEARAYLGHGDVLHWVAEVDGAVVGHLQCSVLHKRCAEAREVLLYEVGVRSAHRRRGVGRALMEALRAWMEEQGLAEAWVLADNAGAVAFYRACGFQTVVPAPTYLMAQRAKVRPPRPGRPPSSQ